MKKLFCVVAGFLALTPAPRAAAALIDTLTGLTPGDLIGCDYTFQNGDPSIPCAKDTVGADGTVSFVKPDAAYDNIEYYDVTTGGDIFEMVTPPGTPVEDNLTPGTEYPILRPVGTFQSFFDVFFEIEISGFNNAGLNELGTFTVGETFTFTDGLSTGLPDTTIPGFTGTVEVAGFDEVSNSPEPSSVMLLCAGSGVLYFRRRRSSRAS